MLATLSALLKRGRLEIVPVTHVKSDAEERQVRELLSSAGLIALGLDPRRFVFCDTHEGVVHIVRNIAPDVHIDVRPARIWDLVKWVPDLVYTVLSPLSETSSLLSDDDFSSAQNVRVLDSLAEFK
nr:hypothetical protein HK105_000794 [Polyrhizophydium stewartii]